jgi:ubiquinone/menaquinone biosynthesis C-methylase UbiE
VSLLPFETPFGKTPGPAARAAGRAVDLVRRLRPAPGSLVLEVGSGAGDTALALACACDLEVVGIDADPGRVHEARRRARGNRRVCFFVEDAAALPFHRAAFDIVLALRATYRARDWERALCEMERVLKPGGRLVFSDVLLPDWLGALGTGIARRALAPTWKGFERFLGTHPLRAEAVARSPLHWEGVLTKAA